MKKLLRLGFLSALTLLAFVSIAPGSVTAAPEPAPLYAVQPEVSFYGPDGPPQPFPSDVMIGEDLTFTILFDNTGTGSETGYGPFIDLYLPLAGPDGSGGPPSDGIDFVSASYLSAGLTTYEEVFTGASVSHPLAVEFPTGAPVTVNGSVGDKLVVIELPFGSITPDQPPLEVQVTVHISDLADMGALMTMYARGGFRFGATALNDWCCVEGSLMYPPANTAGPPWPSASVTPQMMTISKTYEGPEDEIPTGPNFQGPGSFGQYTIEVDVATGQPVNNLQVTDVLPDAVQPVNVTSSPAGSINAASTIDMVTPSPGGTLIYDFAGVITGGAGTDATVTIDFYIPLNEGGGKVLDPDSGNDVTDTNTSSASANWTPLDSRDTGGSVPAVCVGCDADLTYKSITTQKGVSLFTDTGWGGYTPGDTVRYTIDFQVSDFFAFEDLIVTDVLSDGHAYVPGSAQLSINEHDQNSPGAAFGGGNVGVAGGPPVAGVTTLTFDVSQELVDRGLDDMLLGGCIPLLPADGGPGTGGVPPTPGNDPDCGTYNGGPTNGQITFEATIQEDYTDPVPSGDQSVDHGDVLDDAVTVEGDVLYFGDLSPTGQSEDDDSSAELTIVQGDLTKDIYAYSPDNGATWNMGMPAYISPGDWITFSLYYELPSTDTEHLTFEDYLPLPVFDATEVTVVNDVKSATPPDAGNAHFGPGDTFSGVAAGGVSGIVPALTTSSDANSITFDYGTYDGGMTSTNYVQLLFTLTVSDQPFADGLYLTNQSRVSETNSFSETTVIDKIIQFRLGEPELQTTKAVVATNNPAAVFTGTGPSVPFTDPPDMSVPRFIGIINDPSQVGNANVENMDGSDRVTFAIVVYNVGHSPKGAFDITVRDELQTPQFVIPGYGVDGINMTVTYGNGDPVPYTDVNVGNPGLFGDGIEFTDPGPDEGACQAPGHADQHDIIIITYDLQIQPGIAPNTVITNTSHIMSYAGSEGGPDHLPFTPDDDITDTARVVVGSTAGKIAAPDIVTVGETYRQRITVSIPPFTRMEERLPAGSGVVYLRDSILNNGAHGLLGTESFEAIPGANCSDTDLTSPAFQAAITVTTQDTAAGEDVIWSFPAPIDNGTGATECSFAVEIDIVVVDVDRGILPDGANHRYWVPPTDIAMTLDDEAIFEYSNGVANLEFSSGSYSVNVNQPVIDLEKSVMQLLDRYGNPKVPGEELRRGEFIVYAFTLENVGEATAFEVNIDDTLPMHVRYVSGSTFQDDNGNGVRDAGEATLANPQITGTPTTTGQTLSFNYNLDIDVGAASMVRIAYRVRVLDSMPLGTLLNNLADADWSTMDGNQPDERTYDDAPDISIDSGVVGTEDTDSAQAQMVDLTISKAFVPPAIGIGGISTLTFTVDNPNANTDLSGITFRDDLPSGVEIANPANVVLTNCGPAATVIANPGNSRITFSDGFLARGDTCTVEVDVTSSTPNVYDNESEEVSSTETGPDGTAVDSLIVADELSVHKSFSPRTISPGRTSTLTLTIFNPGPHDPVTNVSVVDDLPAGLTVVSPGATPGVCNGGTLTTTATQISLTGGTLAQGDYCTFSVDVTADSQGRYSNTTNAVSSNETGPTSPSNTAVLSVIKSVSPRMVGTLPTGLLVMDPAFSKAGDPAHAVIGETVTWTITVTNVGATPMSPVFVNDPIPDFLDITGVSTTQGTASVSGQVVTVDIGTLAPGATVVITVQTVTNALAQAGQLCNTATMTATTGSGAAATTSTLTAVDCIELYPGELPPTGGDGAAMRYVWIALAIGAALGGFWMWRRRRRKRSAILAR